MSIPRRFAWLCIHVMGCEVHAVQRIHMVAVVLEIGLSNLVSPLTRAAP